MKIMSLDVSTKSTGVAIFDNKQLIEYYNFTASSTDVIKRIQKITKAIEETIEKNKDIEKLILEEVRPDENTQGMNMNTHRALMWAQAAIAFMLHEKYPKISIEYVFPGTWRKTCGIKTGRGIKRDTLKQADIEFAEKTYRISGINDDIADAICIGHSYLQQFEEGFDWG